MRRALPFLLALLAGCAAVRSLFPEPYPYQVPEGAVRIHGPVARAVGVAFNDFVTELASERSTPDASRDAGGGSPGDEPSPEALERRRAAEECAGRPDFYDAWYRLDDGGTRYIVDIYPKPEVCFGPEVEIYGGGAIYEVDAKSFEILKKELQE